jgi:hypothetical protein
VGRGLYSRGAGTDTVSVVKLLRLLAGVGLALVAAVAAGGCTTHAGAAAQVGSQSVETSTLRGIVDRGVAAVHTVPAEQAAQALDRPELQRRALTILVQRQLLDVEAARLGLSIDAQDVDAYYQAYGILEFGSVQAFQRRAAAAGFAVEDVRTIMFSGALEQAIQDKIAPTVLASDAEVQAQYDNIVAQAGEIPLTLEQARPYLARFLVGEKRAARMRPLLVDASKREGVAVNPRFGTWDAEQFAVVAADGSIATKTVPEPGLDRSAQS